MALLFFILLILVASELILRYRSNNSIGLITLLENNQKERATELTQNIENTAVEARHALQSLNSLSSRNLYMDGESKEKWKSHWQSTFLKVVSINTKRKHHANSNDVQVLEKFQKYYSRFDEVQAKYNQTYIESELNQFKDLFDSIENKPMDLQQRISAICDENNMLVNAGAGSGKTLTLLGKIKYLLKRHQINDSEILVLMFNTKNTQEFRERARKDLGCKIDVFTFHALGLQIIKDASNKPVKVDNYSLNKFINGYFKKLEANPDKLLKFIYFLSYYFSIYIDEHDEEYEDNFEKYCEDYRNVNLRTLLGEMADSQQEKIIADFYFMNGVKYSLGTPYEYAASKNGKRIYYPDFQFPEYPGIYHEHFGIDRDGRVPSFFKGDSKHTGQELYEQSMQWKRDAHASYGTTLLETYSFQFNDDSIYKALKDNLYSVGIKLQPQSPKKLWREIEINQSSEIEAFKKLVSTTINQMKGSGLSPDDLRIRNRKRYSGKLRKRNELILDFTEDIFINYNSSLKESGFIDFNDMILDATTYIRNNTVSRNYKYIIVDEYQDISPARFTLLKALQDQSGAKLTGVGDDWQSIFRFAGSKVNLFTKFNEINKHSIILQIEQTFRYDQTVANVAKTFIEKNPSQLKKKVVSKVNQIDSGIEPVYCIDENHYLESFKSVLQLLPRRNIGDKQLHVMLLGRYNSDVNHLTNNGILSESSNGQLFFKPRPDIFINFSTIHRSKGLEADYIIILNNKDDRYGFPSKIEDDLFLNLLDEVDELYPFAEERRLMYVALTRPRIKCYLMIESNIKSAFIKELEAQEGWQDQYYAKKLKCPECPGELVLRTSRFGKFYGCSNYPRCTYTKNIKTNNLK